jgi:uncharacterized membrane protein YtjA (UPF0391 family)
MLSYTLRFLAVALFAIAFGFPGLAANAVQIATILFASFLMLSLAAMISRQFSTQ